MATRRAGENPYRPYYIPPSIQHEPSDPLPKPDPHPFTHGNATGKYASRARDMFSELDYKEYISEPSPSTVQSVKQIVDELLWKYTSVLMAQPFEVAKTILQVRVQDDPGALTLVATAAPVAVEETKARKQSQRISMYDEVGNELFPDSDSDPDEPAYFTSNMPGTPSPYPRAQKQRQMTPLQSPQPPKPTATAPEYQLAIRTPDSVLEVISQLWSKEGAWGVWKGSNATFVYSVLQSLLENWSRSLLSALFNVPDLGIQDDVDRLIDIASPYPWASFFVAAAAAVTTGLILSPLDLVRIRLIISPTSRPPRRMLSALRRLPSYLCPSSIFVPTILHSLIHPLLTLSAPLILRTHFLIHRDVSPMTFSAAKFFSSSVALSLKLPLETILRRGQVAVLSSPAYVHALDMAPSKGGKRAATEAAALETIVPPGQFNGVLGTMYTIVAKEGSRPAAPGAKPRPASRKAKTKIAETVFRRGQGLEGLWRGWKVSWWGLVGLWAANVAGGGGNGQF